MPSPWARLTLLAFTEGKGSFILRWGVEMSRHMRIIWCIITERHGKNYGLAGIVGLLDLITISSY